MLSSATLSSLLLLLPLTQAANHRVDVGFNGTGAALRFSPNSTVAAAGDTVEFRFHTGFHNVASGAFGSPCSLGTPGNNSFNSGYNRVTAPTTVGNQSYTILINDTRPIWYYCSQGGNASHCMLGMVGVINPPAASTNRTLSVYAAGARDKTFAENIFPVPFVGTNATVPSNSTATTTGAAGTTTAPGGGAGTTAAPTTGGAGGSATSGAPVTTTSRPAEGAVNAVGRWVAGAAAVAGGVVMVL